ncbi:MULTISPECIES: sirohydrochlorin chelatase [unclassified Streptomyces]|uniref:sirohydrochlorin chelatase n=1 Tax=unclassified Streptomyces TaxID=2593676 RepID=UPI000700BE01|nr:MULTISPECIES: sirohydrochlorin chelatase [unclassified Streptomyces]KQX53048.1 sirohydrochlorin cobaltochelatase [Streptomyces sp. Root1304]KRA89969.1 sirohydrochlorin cobaltochelatase [Streptomyces sp. Root66D1]
MTEPDSTLANAAELLGRITEQLGAQLGHLPLPKARPRATAPALVAVGHGSRDPRARATLNRLLDRVRELRPGLDVRLAHIELNAPLLDATLADLAAEGREAVLVPLLLAPGHHVTHDLPAALAAVPALRARVAGPLGAHPLLVEALADRLAQAGWTSRRGDGVVLASAGSRDPRSGAEIRRIAALLGERLGGVPVVPAYASATAPTVPDAVRTLAARGRHRVAVASCFTAPGLFASRAAADAPWIASDPLGAHPALARLLLHRYEMARVREPAAV